MVAAVPALELMTARRAEPEPVRVIVPVTVVVVEAGKVMVLAEALVSRSSVVKVLAPVIVKAAVPVAMWRRVGYMRPSPTKVLVTPESVAVMSMIAVPGSKVKAPVLATFQTLVVPVRYRFQVPDPMVNARVPATFETKLPTVTFPVATREPSASVKDKLEATDKLKASERV